MAGRWSFANLIFIFTALIFAAQISGCGGGSNVGVMITKPIIDSIDASLTSENTGETGRAVMVELSGRLPSFTGDSVALATDTAYFNSRYIITSADLASPAEPMGNCTAAGGEFKVSINMLTAARSLLEDKYPLITVREKSTGIIIYSAVPGRIPKIYEMPAGLKKLIVKNVRLDALSTARTAVIMQKGPADIALARMSRPEVLEDGSIIKELAGGMTTEFEAETDRKFGGTANIISLSYAAEAAALTVSAFKGRAQELLSLIAVSRDGPAAVAETFVKLLNSRFYEAPASRRELKFEFIGLSGLYTFKVSALTPLETLPALFAGIQPLETVAAPVFEPYDTTSAVDSLRIYISCATPGARIFYTRDGTDPLSGGGIEYSGPFEISSSATLKASAVKEGMENSGVATARYTIISDPSKKIPEPFIRPQPGIYFSESVEITFWTAVAGAAVIYTQDGSRPSRNNGAVYTGPFRITGSAAFRVISILDGWADSEESSAEFELKVPEPIFKPASGVYAGPLSVKIECSHAGAIIMYSVAAAGERPSDFVIYGGGEILIERSSTISAFAYSPGKTSSAVVDAEYAINAPQDDGT
jgi:hypothetical protein